MNDIEIDPDSGRPFIPASANWARARLVTPNLLGVQLANTWPKITTRDAYGMVRNGKERENLDFSSVAATFEKAITYVFAESPFRNAEARSSTLLCSPNNLSPLNKLHSQLSRGWFSEVANM